MPSLPRCGGAGAIIGTEAAARSPADSYTIYVGGSVSMAVSPALYAKVGYDPVKDFAPVSLVSKFFNAVAVHPSVPVKSVKELIAFSRAHPGEILMASAGQGSTSHLAGELFMSMSGVKWVHVPYKGGGQSVTAVLAGESHIMIAPISTAAPHAKTGRMRVLAVTAPQRVASLPDLPTVSEARAQGIRVWRLAGDLRAPPAPCWGIKGIGPARPAIPPASTCTSQSSNQPPRRRSRTQSAQSCA